MTTPITILTGFLGSGKTTLLNQALREPRLAGALVVVNELGAVPLDHLLVKEVREDVLVLESGCVCCSIRGDLIDTLLEEAARQAPLPFDRVLVESTGLADPTPIIATLVRHPELTRSFHLDAVITAVDAQHGVATLARHEEARKQVVLADDLIVTKHDLVDIGRRSSLRDEIAALNPRARRFSAERGVLDWQPLLEWSASTVASRFDVLLDEPPHQGAAVRSFTVRVDGAVEFSALAWWLSMMTQFHGETLLRVKGLVQVDDEPGPVVIQTVQHVTYPTYAMNRWPSDDHSSRLVVITRGMDPDLFEALRASLQKLLESPKIANCGSESAQQIEGAPS